MKFVTVASAVWKARRRKVLSCSYCPPNQGENSNRRNKHFSRSWKVRPAKSNLRKKFFDPDARIKTKKNHQWE